MFGLNLNSFHVFVLSLLIIISFRFKLNEIILRNLKIQIDIKLRMLLVLILLPRLLDIRQNHGPPIDIVQVILLQLVVLLHF